MQALAIEKFWQGDPPINKFILPTLNEKYDVVFIDAAKGKYPFFLEQALRMLKDDGIILADNKEILCDALILTTGTYLRSKILVGSTSKEEGPHGEKRSNNLSNVLKSYGFEIQRLKTGTPQRLDCSTIDFSKLKEESGDDCYWTFSFDNGPLYDKDKQIKCHIVYTTPETHEIIRKNLKKSAMYGGYAEGIGPRYCPSIEDKVVRFADK